ncbi:hypothetical protein RRG08_047268 [Elysia crispata]|uniref:Uncharacterized protein n=1 Tax=Elysia crispata TaxID=231223 RepID=A0AAE0ZCH2_9GAST|nr:hypothetical protein RRG08_047268 [Elysia crispata]
MNHLIGSWRKGWTSGRYRISPDSRFLAGGVDIGSVSDITGQSVPRGRGGHRVGIGYHWTVGSWRVEWTSGRYRISLDSRFLAAGVDIGSVSDITGQLVPGGRGGGDIESVSDITGQLIPGGRGGHRVGIGYHWTVGSWRQEWTSGRYRITLDNRFLAAGVDIGSVSDITGQSVPGGRGGHRVGIGYHWTVGSWRVEWTSGRYRISLDSRFLAAGVDIGSVSDITGQSVPGDQLTVASGHYRLSEAASWSRHGQALIKRPGLVMAE